MQRSLNDLHRLADFKVRVDRDDFVLASFFAQGGNSLAGERRDLLAKVQDVVDAGSVLDCAMLLRIDEMREDVAWKHRLDEPDRAAPRRAAESQARRKAGDTELFAKPSRNEMLPLRLCFQAEPQRVFNGG